MSSHEEDETHFEGTVISISSPKASFGAMERIQYGIVDDLLYNIIHDIVLQTQREEKIARARTAAIDIEDLVASGLAAIEPATYPTEPRRLETSSARYEDAAVTIKGNPLLTTPDNRCPKCRLPKLQYPVDGYGAQMPLEGIQYCSAHPFITKPDHDIYGNPFPKDEASTKPKKTPKSKMADRLGVSSQQSLDGLDSSFESLTPNPSPPPAGDATRAVPAKSYFPNVHCPHPDCGRPISVRVFAKHYQSHLKTGGRSAGRAALARLNEQAKAGSRHGSTPPGSRRGTPGPSAPKSSPTKRGAEDLEDQYELGMDVDDDDGESNGRGGLHHKRSLKKVKRNEKIHRIKILPKATAALLNGKAAGATSALKNGVGSGSINMDLSEDRISDDSQTMSPR